MKKSIRLRDIMQTSLVTLPGNMEINRAMRVLLDADISGAPVLDEAGTPIGILSQKDCLKAALNAHYYQSWGGQVTDYMTAHIEKLDADLSLVEVANHFLHSNYRRFPVMDGSTMVGLVSRRDLLLALCEQWH